MGGTRDRRPARDRAPSGVTGSCCGPLARPGVLRCPAVAARHGDRSRGSPRLARRLRRRRHPGHRDRHRGVVVSHLDRIAALLVKAERSDNVHEAEAYLAKAQALATQASVDLAVARALTARREAREQPVSVTITIGERGKRANTHLVSLFVVVGQCNSLQIDIAHNSTYVIAYGMPSDIELVEALFGSLATQMTASATSWLAIGEWRGDTYISRDGWRKEHTAQTARAAFYRAFIDRIGDRLQEAREEVLAEAERQRVEIPAEVSGAKAVATTGALVLRSKEAEVRAFYRQSSSARGRWSGYSGGVSRRGGSASRAGRDAAARARLTSAKGISGKGPGLSA
ncbi:MAG: hypothetical protein B7C55_11615 [Actinomycetales bacterium mxb001]|nr:MAG: hypothetical protein B7C55_11615 [Actinomycetales bacterium mxb001]